MASVYVIGTTKRIKIGVANSPILRLSSLQVGSPVKLWLFGFAVVEPRLRAFEVERRIHSKLMGRWLWGEWFKVGPAEAIALIEREIGEKLLESSMPVLPESRRPRRPHLVFDAGQREDSELSNRIKLLTKSKNIT